MLLGDGAPILRQLVLLVLLILVVVLVVDLSTRTSIYLKKNCLEVFTATYCNSINSFRADSRVS